MFDFPLTVASLDDVPEPFRALYKEGENEGELVLIEDLARKISKLADALDKERKRAKDSSRDAKAWAELGETPDAVKKKIADMQAEAAAKISELEKLIDEKGDASSKFEKIRQELIKTHKEELEARDKAVREMEATLQRHLVESAAKSAIAEAKGKVKPLLPYVLQNLKLVKENGEYQVVVLDEDGEPRYTRDGSKPMDIRALVEELKADNEFAALFEATSTSGSGARTNTKGDLPGLTSNPWNPKKPNLTEQMRITKENPARAALLKSQALAG